MAGLKKTAFIIALLMLFGLSESASARTASDRYVERLLGGHRVVNVVDDFLAFWEQAQWKSPRRQRGLWMEMVESKHKDYFDRTVYRNADNQERMVMLDGFLARVPEHIEAIREFNQRVNDVRTNPIIDALINFKEFRFRQYRQQQDIYVGLSFFTFDGSVRPLNNDAGIPDTLCLGAEVLAGYKPEQVRMAIIHEFFHLYHFGFLFQHPVLSDFRTPHLPLMIEGMAVAGTEEAYPSQPRALYLHFSESELAEQSALLGASSRRFLNLIWEDAPQESYEQWFTAQSSEIPSRGGYLLGYEITRRVLATSTLEQMVRMTPAQLREHVEEQLAAMAGSQL
jgi:predicted Zn-dependent protease DUF2268